MPCSLSTFSASSKITGSTFSRSVTSRFHISRSIALVIPACSMQLLVVGRVPRLQDHRAQVEALDQHAALVVHREVRGPDHPLAAALAQPRLGGVEQRAAATSGSSSNSMKPNQPQFFFWCSLKAWLIWAVMRPTTRPSRRARKYSASPWREEGVHACG